MWEEAVAENSELNFPGVHLNCKLYVCLIKSSIQSEKTLPSILEVEDF